MLGFATIALVIILGTAILTPFRRKIGGAGGGSEKAIVGGMWLLGAVVIAIAISGR